MAGPPNLQDCAPSLQYLTQVDQLIIQQQVELLEALTGFETNNKYQVRNSMGQLIYFAAEDTDCCTRNLCGRMRPFNMSLIDNFGNVVFHINRPLRSDSCCCPCCLQEMTVSTPTGQVIGIVKQLWHPLRPKFAVQDHTGKTLLYIRGPICACHCCEAHFNVLALNGETNVGRITKQWSGLLKEVFTKADNFGISFPLDLDVRVKVTLLSAAFLIDFMFFEHDQDSGPDVGTF